MTTEHHSCGIDSITSMSCRGRAQAFAQSLQSRLQSLRHAGSLVGSTGNVETEDESSWRSCHTQEDVTNLQPQLSSSTESDVYFDFDLEYGTSRSPEEEITEYDLANCIVNASGGDYLPTECECRSQACSQETSDTFNDPTSPDSDSSDGLYFDPEIPDTDLLPVATFKSSKEPQFIISSNYNNKLNTNNNNNEESASNGALSELAAEQSKCFSKSSRVEPAVQEECNSFESDTSITNIVPVKTADTQNISACVQSRTEPLSTKHDDYSAHCRDCDDFQSSSAGNELNLVQTEDVVPRECSNPETSDCLNNNKDLSFGNSKEIPNTRIVSCKFEGIHHCISASDNVRPPDPEINVTTQESQCQNAQMVTEILSSRNLEEACEPLPDVHDKPSDTLSDADRIRTEHPVEYLTENSNIKNVSVSFPETHRNKESSANSVNNGNVNSETAQFVTDRTSIQHAQSELIDIPAESIRGTGERTNWDPQPNSEMKIAFQENQISESRKQNASKAIDDEENENNPRIRRCSSLKTGKTPPGTPCRKKIVRFADALGLDLTDIRTFLDEIPRVPNSAYEDLLDADLSLGIPSSQILESTMALGVHSVATLHKPDRCLVPLFEQPAGHPDYLNRVRERQVCLENALVNDVVTFSIVGSVRVRNLDFNKSVHIRYTLDGWKTFADLQATYVPNTCDGFSDQFTFLLYAHTLSVGQRLEFAIRFQCRGCQYWDNNLGANYCFQCLPPAAPTPCLPLDSSVNWAFY